MITINNNYKRKISDIENNYSINNNIDNDNSNSNKYSYKKFKEIKVENFKLIELQSLAASLQLNKSGPKQQLYDRINIYLQTINSIEEEGQIKQNLNQFNKYQPKLVISDQVLPLELLFWKIFRNKAIYTNIFSNFQYNQIYSYHDIIGVGTTLNKYSNGQEIIKDKIKSNNYIIRDYQNDIASIFKTFIKDNQDINQFYNNFFNLYKPTNQTIQFESNPQHWISTIINESNVTALKIYINKFKITQQQIKSIISKCNLYLNSTYQQFKMYHYLAINNYLPLDYQFNIDLINIFTPNFKFRHLIKYFSAIINNIKYYKNNYVIKTYINNNGKNNNKNTNKDNSTKYNQIVTELKQIKLDQFTNQQLNTTLKELAINEFLNDIGDSDSDSGCNTSNNRKSSNKSSNGGEINEIIYKYCKIIYSKSRNKPNEYYTFYKDYNHCKVQNILNKQIFTNKPSLSESVYALTVLDIVQVTLRDNYQEQEMIFRRIFKELQKSEFRYKKKLFGFIVSSNNIDLIDRFLRIDRSTSFSLNLVSVSSIFKRIKSTLVLDYFYENEKSRYFSNGNSNWKFINSTYILNHYKMLMNKCGRSFGIEMSIEAFKVGLYYNTFTPVEFWNWMKRVTSKEKLFQFIKEAKIGQYYVELPLEIENDNDDSNGNKDIQKKVLAFKGDQLFNFLCYSHWFNLSEVFIEFPKFMNFVKIKIDHNSNKYPSSSLKFLIVNTLDKLINYSSNNIVNEKRSLKEIILNLFNLICYLGYLPLVKQLFSKYPNLIKNTPTSKSILLSESIYELIKKSAIGGNEELAYFLINYISPSKNELRQLKTTVSKEINRKILINKSK